MISGTLRYRRRLHLNGLLKIYQIEGWINCKHHVLSVEESVLSGIKSVAYMFL